MDKYVNGSLWRKKETKTTAILQSLSEGLFCLLEMGEGGLSVVVDSAQAGKWQYSQDEVPALLEGWELLPASHLSVEYPEVAKHSPDPAEEFRAKKSEEEQEVIKSVKRKVRKGKI